MQGVRVMMNKVTISRDDTDEEIAQHLWDLIGTDRVELVAVALLRELTMLVDDRADYLTYTAMVVEAEAHRLSPDPNPNADIVGPRRLECA
jgi:hypothetical protein